jgi:hypothetical protein
VYARSVLRASLDPINQHVKFVLFDILWRSIWLACGAVAVLVLWFVVVGQLGALELQGPDLGGSGPIILLAALRQFWNTYGVTLIGEFGALLVGGFLLWVILEALFRGGFQSFWIYLGTSLGRLSLLGGAVAVFAVLAAGDDSRGTVIVGVVLVFGLWFMVSLFETAIRRDALGVIAVDLPKFLRVLGTLLLAEAFLAFLLWGSVLAALARTSGAVLASVVLLIGAIVVPFWMVLHSYLIAVRFSAIDIMRRNLE